MTKYYTGIGSREQTEEMIGTMKQIGKLMSESGYVLRSGAARGADLAFQSGADHELTEIWIPWDSFKPNGINGNYKTITGIQFAVARDWLVRSGVIPWFDKMKQGAQKLHARNYYQIFGDNNQTSEFVLYAAPVKNGDVQGGTRTAVMLAQLHGIYAFNLAVEEELNMFRKYYKEVVRKDG